MIDYLLENGIKSIVFWLIGIVLLGLAAYVFGIGPASFPRVSSGKWQAVFLSNDQVYFGKLKEYTAEYVTLTDVYYLRTASDLEQSGGALNLIKLGGELHGPEDEIFIPKSSVVFWENLKDSSRVVQSITNARR